MSMPDLWNTARNIEGPLFQGARELFLAKQGKMEYAEGRTRYTPTGDPAVAGKIIVNRIELNGYTQFFGGVLQSLRVCLTHEMGHFMGELQAKASRPSADGPATAHIDWCYMHEARATLFAYRVAKELQAKGLPAHVLAPTHTMDVFAVMAEAERTGKNLLMLAKSFYTTSSTYTATCRSQVPTTARGTPNVAEVRIVGKRPSRAPSMRR